MGYYRKCKCGHNVFFTTKTVYHELNVTVNEDGSLVDSDIWDKAEFQPDEPYGAFCCEKCNKTYEDIYVDERRLNVRRRITPK